MPKTFKSINWCVFKHIQFARESSPVTLYFDVFDIDFALIPRISKYMANRTVTMNPLAVRYRSRQFIIQTRLFKHLYSLHVDISSIVQKICFLSKNVKWAIRTISNEHYRCHTGPLFKKHNNVFDTFKLELFMYKHQQNLLPQTFSDYFRKHNHVHNKKSVF